MVLNNLQDIGLRDLQKQWFPLNACKQSQGNHTLFIKHPLTSKLTILLVYVDNMIIAADEEKEKLAQ